MKQSADKMHIQSLRRRVFLRFLAVYSIFTVLYIALFLIFGDLLFEFLSKVLYRIIGRWIPPEWYWDFFGINLRIFLPAIGYFAAILLIFWFSARRLIRYIEQVAQAADNLLQPNETLAVLPGDLKPVETTFNQLKMAAARDRRLASEAEQRKNDLVVYLAHDLKTPLTSVVGYLSLLDEAPDMPPEQRAKYIGITLKKAYRLETLLDEFFDITRFNLHTIVLNKEEVDLSYMLMQLADEFYPMLAPEGKTARIDAPEKLLIFADADKLARVFNNVLKNAVAYSEAGGTIRISAAQGETGVAVKITNTGHPIPAGKLAYIFEKFYRLDSGRSTGKGGAGLGLAIAREIMEAHGGTISAESGEAATTFTVFLPGGPAPV